MTRPDTAEGRRLLDRWQRVAGRAVVGEILWSTEQRASEALTAWLRENAPALLDRSDRLDEAENALREIEREYRRAPEEYAYKVARAALARLGDQPAQEAEA